MFSSGPLPHSSDSRPRPLKVEDFFVSLLRVVQVTLVLFRVTIDNA